MSRAFVFVNLAVDAGYAGVNHGIAFLVPLANRCGYDVFCINLTQKISQELFKLQLKSLKDNYDNLIV